MGSNADEFFAFSFVRKVAHGDTNLGVRQNVTQKGVSQGLLRLALAQGGAHSSHPHCIPDFIPVLRRAFAPEISNTLSLCWVLEEGIAWSGMARAASDRRKCGDRARMRRRRRFITFCRPIRVVSSFVNLLLLFFRVQNC